MISYLSHFPLVNGSLQRLSLLFSESRSRWGTASPWWRQSFWTLHGRRCLIGWRLWCVYIALESNFDGVMRFYLVSDLTSTLEYGWCGLYSVTSVPKARSIILKESKTPVHDAVMTKVWYRFRIVELACKFRPRSRPSRACVFSFLLFLLIPT